MRMIYLFYTRFKLVVVYSFVSPSLTAVHPVSSTWFTEFQPPPINAPPISYQICMYACMLNLDRESWFMYFGASDNICGTNATAKNSWYQIWTIVVDGVPFHHYESICMWFSYGPVMYMSPLVGQKNRCWKLVIHKWWSPMFQTYEVWLCIHTCNFSANTHTCTLY